MKQKRYELGTLVRMALLVALNCISAYVIIPIPFSLSPISLQTLVVNVTAFILPPKQAAAAIAAYIALGMIGVPVFTGGAAGPGKMFGPTGGYIWGYVAAAAAVSYAKGKTYHFRRYALAGAGVGIPIIYLCGCAQLHMVTAMPWDAAVMSGAVPFIPLDIVKCLGAAAAARPICRLAGR